MGAIHQNIEQFKCTNEKDYRTNKISQWYKMVNEFPCFWETAQKEVFGTEYRGNE